MTRTIYQNFAKAGMFSGSIGDDRSWNKVSTMKFLVNSISGYHESRLEYIDCHFGCLSLVGCLGT